MTISLNGTTGITTPAETVSGNEIVTGDSSVTGNLTVTGLINANGGGIIKSGTLISTATTTFSGSIASGGTVLTAGTPTAGTIQIGQVIAGTNVAAGTSILAQLTGTPGGAGTYTVSTAATGTVNGAITVVGVDFYNIPSTTKRVTVMFNGFSTTGTAIPILQVGSGSVSNTLYVAASGYAINGGTSAVLPQVTGFPITASSSTGAFYYGNATLTLIASNTWVFSWSGTQTGGTATFTGGGGVSPALGGALDRVRITTVNGTDTFDAGSINILYE